MDLNWLEDFLALATHRNFSRAAEARNVTQPAFSRRIQSLEAWVGVMLLERSPQGVTLNEAGEYLRHRAADITRDLQQTRRGAQKIGRRERATLAIAATHALSFTFFPGWIRAHTLLETMGTVNLLSDTMTACERILLAGEVDFLLCHHHAGLKASFETDRFQSVVVGRDVLLPLAAPDCDARLPGTRANPVRLLAYSAASGLGRILDAARASAADTVWLDTVFTSPLAAALLTMAKQGHGVAWLPRSLAADDLAAGRLVNAGAERDAVPVEIRLFRAKDPKSPGAEAFWRAVAT